MDDTMASFHKHCRYRHSSDTIVFIILGAFVWISFQFDILVFAIGFFEGVIYPFNGPAQEQLTCLIEQALLTTSLDSHNGTW